MPGLHQFSTERTFSYDTGLAHGGPWKQGRPRAFEPERTDPLAAPGCISQATELGSVFRGSPEGTVTLPPRLGVPQGLVGRRKSFDQSCLLDHSRKVVQWTCGYSFFNFEMLTL